MKRAFLGVAAFALLLATADAAQAQFRARYSTWGGYGAPVYGYSSYYGPGYSYYGPAYYPSTYYATTSYYSAPSYVVPAGYVSPVGYVAPATSVYYSSPGYYYPGRRGWRYRW